MIRTGVNLIPAARRQTKQRRTRARLWVGAAILCAAAWGTLLVAAQVFLAGDDRKLREQLEQTAAELEEARTAVAGVRSEISRARSTLEAQQAVGRQPDWSVLLALLSSTLGDRAVLRNVRLRASPEASVPASSAAPQPAVTLELGGYAQTQRDVSEFVLRLEQTPLFEKVKLIDTRREPFLSGTAIGFRVMCELESGGGA